MDDEAHLDVITRLIEVVEQLQTGIKDCHRNHVQQSSPESEEHAAKLAPKAMEAKETQDKVLEDALIILGRAALKARKTTYPSTGATLQETKRKAVEKGADYRPRKRQRVDLVSPSPPPSPNPSPIDQSREPLKLSTLIDLTQKSSALFQDVKAFPNDTELVAPKVEMVGHDLENSRPAYASVASASRYEVPWIQNRPQPEATISPVRLSNKFRTPYLLTTDLETSVDGIMQLAQRLRDYGWSDIRADSESYYILFRRDDYGKSEGWKVKDRFDGTEFMGVRLSLHPKRMGVETNVDGPDSKTLMASPPAQPPPVEPAFVRKRVAPIGRISKKRLSGKIKAPFLRIKVGETSAVGVTQLEELFENYDWKDVRADKCAYFIIFSKRRGGRREAQRLKADFEGKEFMGIPLRLGPLYR